MNNESDFINTINELAKNRHKNEKMSFRLIPLLNLIEQKIKEGVPKRKMEKAIHLQAVKKLLIWKKRNWV